jgi:iron(III) transport system ATP-binding protein
VLIDREEVAGPDSFVPPEKRGVGLMFQDFALFPHLTILQNVAFGLRWMNRGEAKAEALAALARVGLDHYANEYPHILSGGEQQRVALARALAPNPDIVLADEPTGNLDEATGSQIIELLFRGHSARGTTLVLVTHDPALAAHCGRVVRLRSGRIESGADERKAVRAQ